MVDGMRERTTLEIADKLDYWTRSVMSIHNVPTLPKLCDCGEKAADMLRQQHAEIERLTALNSALTAKGNAFVIENAWAANSMLIAAAPDLLEVCRRLSHVSLFAVDEDVASIIMLALDTVQKATGEKP